MTSKYDIHNEKANCYHILGEYFGDIVQPSKMPITSMPEVITEFSQRK